MHRAMWTVRSARGIPTRARFFSLSLIWRSSRRCWLQVLAKMLQAADAVSLLSIVATTAVLAAAVCAALNKAQGLSAQRREQALKQCIACSIAFALIFFLTFQGDTTLASDGSLSEGSATVPITAPSHPAYGSMGRPMEAMAILFFAALMLLSMDNFGGLSVLAAAIVGRQDFLDWAKAFGPLHTKIGVGGTALPTNTKGAAVAPAEGDGGGLKKSSAR